MVVMKNSEYRTNYEPKFEKHAQEYSQNLGYRTTRRSAEFAHNRDVFTWEPEAWEKASTTSVLEEVPRPGVNPSTRYKHAMFNKEYNERVLSQCIQEQCHIDDTNNNQSKAEEPKTPPPSPQNEKEETNVAKSTEVQVKEAPATKPKENTVNTKSRPKKPVKCIKVAQNKNAPTRPKSSHGAPVTAKAVTLKPPFVLFGSRDRELQMGVKKTHNVKAPCNVHASAVRAQQYRQQQRDNKKRLKSAPPASRQRRPLSFDDIMDRETSGWTTEYGGHFRNYKTTEYERNAASRMSVPRCTDIDVATSRDGVRIASGMRLVTGKP